MGEQRYQVAKKPLAEKFVGGFVFLLVLALSGFGLLAGYSSVLKSCRQCGSVLCD